ncbi:dTDP-4-dehydrorhamnose 3,5-epimerase [bacterium]|nr:dTDP-4-dehydrorhamnose 3,5-epimerase [bacterium]MBU1071901.1 dTDP-4-dehydrorhamnose 3,5-epimerase [bacterium]MBU1676063.1 dTDP-4-dehydrorhamnose 3,5-epimerase [bacterium]
MKITKTDIPDVLVIEPNVFQDERGFFLESFNVRAWREATGLETVFVQDNHSCSNHGVVRGLHYQVESVQGKLVRVVRGEIYDVALDLRRSSPTCGRWTGVLLSEANKRLCWIPAGFAHAFMALSETADVLYKTTDYYAPEHERSICWDDPDLAIDWPLPANAVLSEKDRRAVPFREAELLP